MATFLWYVCEENLNLTSYVSRAGGTVEMSGGVLQFRFITIETRIGISLEDNHSRVGKMVKKVERASLVTNSIKTDVSIESEIVVE